MENNITLKRMDNQLLVEFYTENYEVIINNEIVLL